MFLTEDIQHYEELKEKKLIETPPADLFLNYNRWINIREDEKNLEAIQISVNEGYPCGRGDWVEKMITTHSVQSTLRSV